MRVGLRRQTHQRLDAAALHELPAAADGSGNDQALAAETKSGRTAAWSAHALWLALRREAHRLRDAEALRRPVPPGDPARRHSNNSAK
ncbi:hypothetical protein SBA4_3400001 [Candidatus Sulfopaludibacter sp. SbA4]|nr:hypothetical protein SBA4_3400001 [Candidatus Sulfopaludibacter sp. SbA4]